MYESLSVFYSMSEGIVSKKAKVSIALFILIFFALGIFVMDSFENETQPVFSGSKIGKHYFSDEERDFLNSEIIGVNQLNG